MPSTIKNIAFALALAGTAIAETQAGCFSDPGSLQSQGEYTFQSQGYCFDLCGKKGSSVAGLKGGNVCACGDEVPTGEKLPDTDCGIPCTGYPAAKCKFLISFPFFSRPCVRIIY
jgi:cell wall integrity and stress response component